MTALKSFGTVAAPIIFSELITHTIANHCGSLQSGEPDADALNKGAQLIVCILFWMRVTIKSHWLGTNDSGKARKATAAEIDAACNEEEVDDTSDIPLTADAAAELKKVFEQMFIIFDVLDNAEEHIEPMLRVRAPIVKLRKCPLCDEWELASRASRTRLE